MALLQASPWGLPALQLLLSRVEGHWELVLARPLSRKLRLTFEKKSERHRERTEAERKCDMQRIMSCVRERKTPNPPKYEALRNSTNGWTIHEAGTAQLDDIVGATMQKLKDMGVDDNTIVVFTTDNGTETFTWPDGGNTPFRGPKGTIYEGGFRAPAMIRWPGHVPAGAVENGIISGLDWSPTLVAAAGNPNIKEELLKGKKIGDMTYKNHLDSYNQLDMTTGKGPSNRHEIYYFGESTLGAVRIDDFKYRFIDQPNGWLGGKVHVDAPSITNLRLDPFERLGYPVNGTLDGAQGFFNEWFMYQFWRFVFVQEEVAKLAETAIEYPPMQKGASFNLDAVKAKIAEAIKAQHSK